ncbi:hypothetical protein CFD26_100075, partial [Aspergillus turcosus]
MPPCNTTNLPGRGASRGAAATTTPAAPRARRGRGGGAQAAAPPAGPPARLLRPLLLRQFRLPLCRDHRALLL